MQRVPDGQAMPHEPQLLLSVDVSRHVPEQLVWPAGQLTTQVALVQV
jgi:hypothetical protein